MTEILKMRRTKLVSALCADLLACEMPLEFRRILTGRKKDGSRKRGRPKKGQLPDGVLGENSTFADALAATLVTNALAGDAIFCKLLLYYVEGLPLRQLATARATPAYGESGSGVTGALEKKLADMLKLTVSQMHQIDDEKKQQAIEAAPENG